MFPECDMHKRSIRAAADTSIAGRASKGLPAAMQHCAVLRWHPSGRAGIKLGHGGLEASPPDLLGLLDDGPPIVVGALVADMLDQLQGLQGLALP